MIFGDGGRNDKTAGSEALVITLALDEFLVAGSGANVHFHTLGARGFNRRHSHRQVGHVRDKMAL